MYFFNKKQKALSNKKEAVDNLNLNCPQPLLILINTKLLFEKESVLIKSYENSTL